MRWTAYLAFPAFLQWFSCSYATKDAAVALEVDLGARFGMSSTTPLPQGVIRAVIRGVERGSKDSMYLLGLIHLYGAGLPRDDAKALQHIRDAAELGHVEAQSTLAVLLLHGRGGGRAPEAAVAWLRQAAHSGSVDAMWLLGRCLYEGTGVTEPDLDEAVTWLLKACERGDPHGQHYMGVVHEYGLGVVQDFGAARRWYEAAAAQGLPEANYHLGLMSAHGRGKPQDFASALVAFQQAARGGSAPAMLYLGKMCLYGHGVPVDYQQALLWFEKAVERAAPASPAAAEARNARDELQFSLEKAKRVNAELLMGFDYGAAGLGSSG